MWDCSFSAGISRCTKIFAANVVETLLVLVLVLVPSCLLCSDTPEVLDTRAHSRIPCFFPVANAWCVLLVHTK